MHCFSICSVLHIRQAGCGETHCFSVNHQNQKLGDGEVIKPISVFIGTALMLINSCKTHFPFASAELQSARNADVQRIGKNVLSSVTVVESVKMFRSMGKYFRIKGELRVIGR